ncbi:DUF1450 domain-containing protein [Proteiniborus sp.]|uniref:DUF1450 domain-containing protein n=1 Tax=Proteiniborus sp. TaxID=2079015 RepID=UPI0033300EB4
MARVQFCENNYEQGAEEVIQKLENDGIEFEVESCLGYCGECAMEPFALVDDELIEADTPDELYNKIKDILEQYR